MSKKLFLGGVTLGLLSAIALWQITDDASSRHSQAMDGNTGNLEQ